MIQITMVYDPFVRVVILCNFFIPRIIQIFVEKNIIAYNLLTVKCDTSLQNMWITSGVDKYFLQNVNIN